MARAIVSCILFAAISAFVRPCDCVALHGLVNSGVDISPRQVEIPTVNNFRWRALESLAVVGDYLFIEGGEISQFINGEKDIYSSRQVNNTASIPLTLSWTNSTVSVRTFKRTAPNAKMFALWADPANKKMYAWGGEGPYGNKTGANNVHLWAFTPDNAGAGSWAASSPNNPAIFNTLTRGTNGAYASCNGVGYYLGGEATSSTDASITAYVVTPGLLTFDMGTSTWTNRSAPAPYSTLLYGQAECVPFGSKGLVAFFGGGYRQVDNTAVFSPVLFSNITFFDPSTNQWLWQRTTGDLPDNRNFFCSVGVAGLNGTFEIFIYAGYQNSGYGAGSSQQVLSDIWVLSIPGFQWFKTGVSGPPRWAHNCALVGKRQMIVVGGVHSYDDPWNAGNPLADPFAQGLGILDLSTLSWSDRYNAGAAAYDSPDIVKKFYNEGGLAAVNWVSPTVKAVFVNASQVTPTSTPTSSSTGSSTPNPTPSGQSKSKSNTPAIAGGVAGGAGLIAVIAGIIFYLRWLKRKRQSGGSPDPAAPGPGSAPAHSQEQHHSWVVPKAELDNNESSHHGSALPGKAPSSVNPVHELPQDPASPRFGELETGSEWHRRHELQG